MKKNKKATSLLEVIVVLAIISLTIVSSVSLVAKTRIQIKNNELTDQINGQVVKALEILKSPSDILISNDTNLTGTDIPYYFNLSNPTQGTYILQYQPNATPFPVISSSSNTVANAAGIPNTSNTTSPNTTPNTTPTDNTQPTNTTTNTTTTTTTTASTGQQLPGCDKTSLFYVTGVLNFDYCQQVRITPRTNIKTNQTFYEINVTLVYKNVQNVNTYQTLNTYRYDVFKKSK